MLSEKSAEKDGTLAPSFIWTLNVMDGFKTSGYITLSGQPVRCCVAGQRGCRLCELHEYIKGALPHTCYTIMLTNKFRACSFITVLPNGNYVCKFWRSIDPSIITTGSWFLMRYRPASEDARATVSPKVNNDGIEIRDEVTSKLRDLLGDVNNFLKSKDNNFFVRLINYDDKRRTKSDDFISTCGAENSNLWLSFLLVLLPFLCKQWKKGTTLSRRELRTKQTNF